MNGTLIGKSHRHDPTASTAAPTSGPAAAANEITPPLMPFSRPSCSGGAYVRSIAIPFGISTAPATACAIRSVTSTAKFGANGVTSASTRNASSPPRYTRARPIWSPSRPPIGCATAIAIR